MNSDEIWTSINYWHDEANSYEKDYFIKFTLDFIALILLIRNEYNIGNNAERDYINKLKEENSEKYIKFLDKSKFSEIKKYLNDYPLINDTNGKDYWDGDFGKINDLSDFKNMIEFIYIARNNLFHGQKRVDFARDKIIIEYAFFFLNPLLDFLISKYNG
ncbi:hypothetical protein MBCUT_16060 [Methanobrevibacter cuticularis]|uniref:Apea-like HEPN domain-containing protein n=1 Tax=Methanobrevibacter cuticularis TaxID=47311 RepID=A0A166D6F8_9EURY|nr:hypothetical protein [Methanobrevibacter cuticularis]KZX15252.1 hypothetical protein MBCUT_16060 [Methanobrevibacter cuticularis]